MFFINSTIINAIVLSTIATFLILIFAICILQIQTKIYNKYKTADNNKKQNTIIALKISYIVLFSITGLFLSNVLMGVSAFTTALSHGMTVNMETNKYDMTLKNILYLNKHTVKESNVSVKNLKDTIIIYVRYDCPDCLAMHEQLNKLDKNEVIFLSSRTKKGKDVREQYNICLTEVPQGVYIDKNGKSTIVDITLGENKDVTLDLKQIETLFDMKNHK